MRVTKDLVAASATPMVLGILAEGDSYGYAILRRINELSGGELDWTEGLLYPLLHRLERLGHVESSWQSVAGERRRKYYRITQGGLAELSEQRRQWDTVVGALRTIWAGRGDSRPSTVIPSTAIPSTVVSLIAGLLTAGLWTAVSLTAVSLTAKPLGGRA